MDNNMQNFVTQEELYEEVFETFETRLVKESMELQTRLMKLKKRFKSRWF